MNTDKSYPTVGVDSLLKLDKNFIQKVPNCFKSSQYSSDQESCKANDKMEILNNYFKQKTIQVKQCQVSKLQFWRGLKASNAAY